MVSTGNFNAQNTFKGVIIADQINAINGGQTVIGAVITLSTISVNQFGAGTAQIYYSSEAVKKYAQGGSGMINKRLSWKKKVSYDAP
jgi:hypothetical protein